MILNSLMIQTTIQETAYIRTIALQLSLAKVRGANMREESGKCTQSTRKAEVEEAKERKGEQGRHGDGNKLRKSQREMQEGEEDRESGGEETLSLFRLLAHKRA